MKKGRRELLTPAMRRRILAQFRRGHTIKNVAASLGFSPRCFHDHCAKDAAFLAQTQHARAEGRMRIVESILDCGDPRWLAWYLERTSADQFGRVEPRKLVIEYQQPPPPAPPVVQVSEETRWLGTPVPISLPRFDSNGAEE